MASTSNVETKKVAARVAKDSLDLVTLYGYHLSGQTMDNRFDTLELTAHCPGWYIEEMDVHENTGYVFLTLCRPAEKSDGWTHVRRVEALQDYFLTHDLQWLMPEPYGVADYHARCDICNQLGWVKDARTVPYDPSSYPVTLALCSSCIEALDDVQIKA